MPRVITVATTALGTVGLGMTRAISAQAQPRPTLPITQVLRDPAAITIGPHAPGRRPQLVIASSAGSNAHGFPCPSPVS
jgi:hypothetical protein